MAKSILERIIKDIKQQPKKVLLIENNDGFLFREDVQNFLKENSIECASGTNISQRVAFELRDKSSGFLFLNKNKKKYLEDIEQVASEFEFFLSKYCSGYHTPTLVSQPLNVLDKLGTSLRTLNKQDTLRVLASLVNTTSAKKVNVSVEIDKLFKLLEADTVNWPKLSQQLAVLVLRTIGTNHWSETQSIITQCNELYHESFGGVMSLQNSSFIKSPKIVSHILPHLKMKYVSEKIALIVVDGLGLWQYELLKENLSGKITTQVINSWLPSITQLSRQAIFRGDIPEIDYKQGPRNEEKLWFKFWSENSIPKPQIQYLYEPKEIEQYGGVTKLAMVYKDLDEMMHGSKDLQYLKSSTEIWLTQSSILNNVKYLLSNEFTVFIATDHGNVQARGWRSLTGREKLGANKSGSKSQRHLEYSDKTLYEDFIQSNQELERSIVQEEQAIYFKDDLSFSRDESLVAHGGAHLLEMLIPFAKITNE
jgi:Fe-S cluster biogenesis protein NfuA